VSAGVPNPSLVLVASLDWVLVMCRNLVVGAAAVPGPRQSPEVAESYPELPVGSRNLEAEGAAVLGPRQSPEVAGGSHLERFVLVQRTLGTEPLSVRRALEPRLEAVAPPKDQPCTIPSLVPSQKLMKLV